MTSEGSWNFCLHGFLSSLKKKKSENPYFTTCWYKDDVTTIRYLNFLFHLKGFAGFLLVLKEIKIFSWPLEVLPALGLMDALAPEKRRR